jgi:hypothetical protein
LAQIKAKYDPASLFRLNQNEGRLTSLAAGRRPRPGAA